MSIYESRQIAQALSSDIRVRILMRLRKRGELTCAEATANMGPRQATMSHHIAILRRTGFVRARRGVAGSRACLMLSIHPERLPLIEAVMA